MLFAERSDVQLYSLLTNLSSLIDHTDYMGLSVGYSIIDALGGFSTTVGSKQKRINAKLSAETVEQLRFEEVKSVYRKLDEVIADARNNGGQAAYDRLKASVGKNIDSIMHDDPRKHESILFKSIIEKISGEKNYIDNIRLKGICLVETVRKKGSFLRPCDYMNQDYRSILISFGDVKH